MTLFKNPHNEGGCPVFSEKVTCPADGSGLDPFIQALLDSGDYTMFVATDSPSEMEFDACFNCYYPPVISMDELSTLVPGEPVKSDDMVEYTDGLPEGFDLDMCGDAATISPTGGPRIPQRASASYGFNLQVASNGPGGGLEKVGISSACRGKEGRIYIDIFSNDPNAAPMCEFSGESNESAKILTFQRLCTTILFVRESLLDVSIAYVSSSSSFCINNFSFYFFLRNGM